jgi:hypothetical protein
VTLLPLARRSHVEQIWCVGLAKPPADCHTSSLRRIGEQVVTVFEWRDVDLEAREIFIRPAKAKTRVGRFAPISARLLARLEVRRLDPAGKQFGPEAYVFGNEVGFGASQLAMFIDPNLDPSSISVPAGFDVTGKPNDWSTWGRLGRDGKDKIQRLFDPAARQPKWRFTIGT